MRLKWFVVRKPSPGEIIATSANQIVLPKFCWTYKNVVLYSPDPPFLLQGSGAETTMCMALSAICHFGGITLFIETSPPPPNPWN